MGGAGEDAAKGMDKASKSAKKLKNNMNTLGINELNIISPDTKSDTGGLGGSGGGGGGAGGGGLDTGGLTGESIFDALGKSDPETPVNEWATRLRNAFLGHDWDKLGEEIAWGINTGLQKVYDAISWENVGPKITPAINAFTQTFNSMVDNINWTLMGQTLGAGVNTLVNSLNLLIEGIDWTNLGVKISDGIRGAISEIQWTNLGNLLGNYFMISWDTLNGFVTGMAQTNMAGLTGFEQVGTAIGSAINGAFQNVDFGTIGTTLVTGFNGIFDAIRALSITVDWSSIATNISTGLNNMIHGINWAESGQSLSRFVTDLLGTIKSVAEQTDWQSLGQGIGDFLGGIDWLTIFSQVFTTITTVIEGLVSGFADTTAGKLGIALGAAIGGIKLGSASIPLMSSVSSVFAPVIGMFKEGGSIYTALSSGASALSGAFTALTGISAPVGVAVAAVAGVIVVVIASIKNLWDTSENFRDAVTGAFDKIKASLTSALDKVKNAISPLIDAIKDLIDTFVDFYNKSKIKKIVELFGTLAATFVGNAISTGIDVLSTAFSGLAGILTGAITTIKGVVKIIQGLFSFDFDKIAEGFKDVGDGILTAFSGMGTLLFDAGKDLISGLLEGIVDSINTIGSWIQENVFQPFIDGFKSVFGIHSPSTVMSEQGGYIIDGLLSGLKNNITSVTDWFTELPGKIKDAAGDAKEWLKDKGSDTITGLKNGYESVKNSEFLDKVATLKDETFNKIGDIKTKVTTKGKNVVEGLKNGYQSIKESQFLTTVSTIKDETFARIGGMKDKITQKGKDVINGLKNGYTQIKESGFLNFVKNIKDETFSSIGNILKTIIPKGKDIIQGLKDGLDDKWPGLSDALSKFPEKIKKAIGDLKEIGKKIMQGLADGIASVDIKLPHITWDWKTLGVGDLSIKVPTNFGVKWYARGGLFDDPSIIGVGEAGREAVLPLENPRTMRMIAKSILNNMPSSGLGMTAQSLSKAVESGVLSGMSRALTNASIINHTDVYQRKDVLSDRVYVGSPVFTDDSVNVSGGRTLEQDARTDYILQQILETSQKILAKDTSVKLDGKRTDTLLSRAKHNSGYSFVTT